jgi:exopolysaccharide biosynthesis polyprenyl glycosylphosphotransferase
MPAWSDTVSPSSVRLVASLGRFVVIWLAVAMVAAAHRPLGLGATAAATVVALVWLLNLRSAASGVEHALGPVVAAAVGTFTGLVSVATVDVFLPGIDLGRLSLVGMALGVFASTAIWDVTVAAARARRRVLVVESSAFTAITAELSQCREARFDVIGPPPDRTGTPLPLLGAEELAEIMRTRRPDLVVLADDTSCAETLDRLLDIADGRFRVAGFTSFFEYAFGRVPLTRITSMWFMGLLDVRQPPAARWSKRAFDIVVAGALLVLTLPLLAILAALVRLTPGPVIYSQTRVGECGRPFRIYKLRTMTRDAEAPGHAVYAAPGDCRVTAVGRVLRATHLDELPQLLNVLKGDMSMVGPRPERPEFIRMLEASVPFWSRRLLIKPGVTGWAQVRCGYARDAETSAEKLSYDFWYLRHRSLAVDLAVCASTFMLMLRDLAPARLRRRAEVSRSA